MADLGSKRTVIPVRHLEDAAVVRSVVRRRAAAEGFSDRVAGEVALGASELATNLVKHAGGGELEVFMDKHGLVVCSLDRGPGPPARDGLLRDGWSRGGARLPDSPIREGLGSGGAALGRLFDQVDVDEREGGGAVIRCVRNRV